MKSTTIQFPTNINGKLYGNAFLHITKTLPKQLNRVETEKLIVHITTADNSHPQVACRIYDVGIVPMGYICDADAFASHGLTKMQLLKELFPDCTFDEAIQKQVCVYYYVKQEVAALFQLPV